MASSSCVHCHEEIPDSAQVCPSCGTWEPFTLFSPSDTDVAVNVDLSSDETVEETKKGWLGDLLKDVALQYAIGCGGILVAIVFGIVIVVIVSSCASRAPIYNQLDCQDYYDELMIDLEAYENPEVQILKITASKESDDIAWDKRICPVVAETTEGNFSLWSVVIEQTSTEWTFETILEELESPPVTVSDPATRQ